MRPWDTKEWKEKRERFIEGRQCEWCGSTEHLVIDHIRNSYPRIESRKFAWQYFVEYFAKRKNRREFLLLFRKAVEGTTLYCRYICPNCHYASVYSRKNKRPTYRCLRCDYEFNEAIKAISFSSKRYVLRRMLKLFMFQYRDKINARFKSHWQKLTEDYLNFKDVIVLCRRCAFARLLGFRLCPVCKQRYYRDIPRSNRKMCWLCFIKTEEGKAYLANIQKRRRKEIREKDFAIDEMQKFLKGLSRGELNKYIHQRLQEKAIDEAIEEMEHLEKTNAGKKVNSLLDEAFGCTEYFGLSLPIFTIPYTLKYTLNQAEENEETVKNMTLEEMIRDLLEIR